MIELFLLTRILDKYKKPEQISHDPSCSEKEDKEYVKQLVGRTLNKEERNLDQWDLENLFAARCPCGGKYAELIYYLPFAFYFLKLKHHPLSDRDYLLWHGVLHFISNKFDELKSDNFEELSIQYIKDAFKDWTKDFKVAHFEGIAQEKDIVENSPTLNGIIELLARLENLSSLGESWIVSLANEKSTDIESAWFLELARQCLKHWEDPTRGLSQEIKRIEDQLGQHPNPKLDKRLREALFSIQNTLKDPAKDWTPAAKKNKVIYDLVTNKKLLEFHYSKIKDTVIAQEKSPTYWKTVKMGLGI